MVSGNKGMMGWNKGGNWTVFARAENFIIGLAAPTTTAQTVTRFVPRV